jgi:Ca-activated chloride channel homolog
MKKIISIVTSLLLLISSNVVLAQSERTTIRKGNDQYKEKKFSEAEKNYRKSLEKNPQSYAGNYNLGNALYKQKKYEDASRQYMQSSGVDADKNNQAHSYYNMGNSFLKAEKYKESVEAYKMALRNNPKDDDARYNLSYALSKMRQQQDQKKDNKDQKKDNKDQKKQDQKKEQQQQDQKKEQQKQEQQAKQQRQPKISKEDAERMLQALKNDEKELQKRKARKYEATGGNPEKDW